MTDAAETPLLSVHQVCKSFPGVRALHEVDLALHPGEVLAVIGENGAGKSTLMKILAGVQLPDTGETRIDGRPVVIDSVQTALAHGIALIHQELNLSGNLDVGANIFLGREPRRFGLIDKNVIREESQRVLSQVGLNVSPDTLAGSLSIGRQQLVEIAKALSVDAQVIIMDEPTSSLSSGESERLFEVIRDLRERGVSIIYISHRLGEVKKLADRVCVLRDGENAGELSRDEITHDAMVQLMVGRDVSQFYARQPHEPGAPLLEVEGLRTSAHPGEELVFHVKQGEIVGVAGLVGAGRTELLRALFGVDPILGGTIKVAGQKVAIRSSLDAIKAGLALVPEDRKGEGLVIDMPVRSNVSLASLRRNRRLGVFRNGTAEQDDTLQMIDQLNIKTPSAEQVVRFLSGGNQQKVVIGKWLSMSPRVLLLDEPTRGIDIGAKQEIYSLMESLAEDGVAVLFVSSEMEEILGMSDRTLVMHEGRITGELSRDQLSEEAVMHLATGGADAA
ncbi:MAG: sugar ABC transporter ATP-binding protein [Planctomycetaceae bacterium]|nr:sugar ABC transporter ATP-binding protein [Planctomycetaceae bacterium]